MPAHSDLIDRDDLVLLVIDLQERLAAAMPHRGDVVAVAARLVRVAALVGAPVIVTRQYPRGLGETVPDVEQALADARGTVPVTVLDKTAFCACGEPGFDEALTSSGRRQVAIVGMEAHICVTQTALALAADGYRVQVVADACCSRADSDRDIAFARLRARGITVTSAESLMYEAVGRSGTDEFRALLGIVKAG
ncbi:MAG: isochorismatase family protein [Coriobacteriia bacterium]|nr:isochorismatase family protein [Coriobacteriia bacterium]